MAFNQTKDVLDYARGFHRHLSEYYDKLKASAHRERTRLLLDYMSRHELYLEQCLKEYEEEVSENVLDTWFKYSSEKNTAACIRSFEIKPEMEPADVIAAAMYFDACLISFYTDMARKSAVPKVRDIFENLLELEKQEALELSKKALEFENV